MTITKTIVGLAASAALLIGAAPARQALPAPQPAPQSAPRPAPARQNDAPATAWPVSDALLADYARSGKVPGIVAAFGLGDADPTFLSAGRIADDATTNAGPDTLWRVYSMTKPITAMAAMLLIEEGKIGLDQPVADFIPAFRTMRVLTDPEHSLATRPATTPITIRHLLTHTAGLGYTIVTKGPLLDEYNRQGIVPFEMTVDLEKQARAVRPATLAAFADRVATLPLIAEPGSKWSYSIALDVLGGVIEVASGMPFDRYLQTRFFSPLRMTSTFFQVPASEAGRLATNYLWLGERRLPADPGPTSVFRQAPEFPYGGAGLVTSARDYDRFLRMLVNGGALDGARVLKPETVALALSNLLPPGVTYPGGGSGPQGFGAGGSVALTDTAAGVGKGIYAWSGAAGTLFWIDPAHRARGTVMVNYTPSDRYPLRREFMRAFYTDYLRAAR